MTPLEIALDLAARGWPTFPCGAHKRPCIPKADGGRGFHDATRDPLEIRRLFSFRGAALVGVPTGEASGIDVLDIDPRHNGDAWERANLHRLPETGVHQTPSGGRHYLFHHAPGVRNSTSEIAPGVDVRGSGGYIVAPPSRGYSIVSDAEIAHWPDWLLALALPPPAPPRAAPTEPRRPIPKDQTERIIASALDRVRNAPDGQKHFSLRNAALLLGGIASQAGISDATALGWLLEALPSSVSDWDTAKATAAWGLENGRARPITIPERPKPSGPDPRRQETAREAFRLLRRGVPSADLLAQLHCQNRRRPDPLPVGVIDDTALWAARTLKERANV